MNSSCHNRSSGCCMSEPSAAILTMPLCLDLVHLERSCVQSDYNNFIHQGCGVVQLHDHDSPRRQSSGNAGPIVMPPTFSGGVALAGPGHMPVPSAYQESKPVGPLHSKSSSRKLINKDRSASEAASMLLTAVISGAIAGTLKTYDGQTVPAQLVCLCCSPWWGEGIGGGGAC